MPGKNFSSLFILITLSSFLLNSFALNELQLARKARGLPLIFPVTAPTRTQWIVGIGIPLENLNFEALTTGYVFKAEYFLPYQVEQLYTKTTMNLTARKLKGATKFEKHVATESELRGNSTTERHKKPVLASYRWSVYKSLEGLANR